MRAPVDAERPERRVVLAACRGRPRSGRPASPASGSRTSARRSPPAPRARRGRTGSRGRAGSAGPGASRRRTSGRRVSSSVRRSPRRRGAHADSRTSRAALADGAISEALDVLADRGARVARRGRGRRRRRRPRRGRRSGSGRARPTSCGRRRRRAALDAATSARSVSASSRFGVVKPASALMPWTPRKSTSRCSERIAVDATGPTSASDGVRTPPVSTTVRSGRGSRWSTFATWIEFVTTVRSGTSCEVVREPPGRRAGGQPDRLARLDEPRCRAGDRLLLLELAVRLRLEARLVRAQPAAERRAAVDLLDEARPRRARRGRGGRSSPRRSSSSVSSLTRTAPWRRTSSTISFWRCAGEHGSFEVGDSHNTQR